MLTYPNIDPVLFHLGPLSVHWYGVMYLFAFASAWGLARWRVAHYHLPWLPEQISDLIFYGALGVVVGGRLGYMLFYQSAGLIAHPLSLFYVWQGGMSFHGGLLGVALAIFIFSKKNKKSFFEVTDFVSPLVPIGLAFGRLGNFINGELWGRVTDVPWAFVFPHVDSYPRHPSQLYEFLTEGVLLFIALWLYARKTRPPKALSGMFLLLYGIFRFSVEFFREPDVGLNFVAFDWMTMGQVLSFPMILIGLLMMALAYQNERNQAKAT
jgi:phosphatidylglycerol:prolipoprotein diacylglycerol transferase